MIFTQFRTSLDLLGAFCFLKILEWIAFTFVQCNSHETSATNDRNMKFRWQYNIRVKITFMLVLKILHSIRNKIYVVSGT